MIIAIDIDGVITANPQAMSWLTYHFTKNFNGNKIVILSWRDGSDEKRKAETIAELERFNIYYNELILAPKKFANLRTAAFWKIAKIAEMKADIWFDDELKIFAREFHIDLDRLLPNVTKIWI